MSDIAMLADTAEAKLERHEKLTPLENGAFLLRVWEGGDRGSPAMTVGSALSIVGELVAALVAPDSLDAAWAEAEAALPEGWFVKGVELSLWAMSRGVSEWFAWAGRDVGEDGDQSTDPAPTPAAALRALAAKLRVKP